MATCSCAFSSILRSMSSFMRWAINSSTFAFISGGRASYASSVRPISRSSFSLIISPGDLDMKS
ncbi:hypothetical protein D3C87_2192060 [compost metagenome]